MATTNTLRQILDRKTWEFMTPAPVANSAGAHIISSNNEDPHQLQMYVTSTTAQWLYYPKQDAWIQTSTVTLGGALQAGATGAYVSAGPTGTATAGSATTMTTNLTIPSSLVGYKIRITAGTGAGQEGTILYNTTGANAVFTFSSSLGTPLDNTSVYELRTGRFYVWNAGTLSATSFQYYDVALNTWTARSVTGVTSPFATDGKLVAGSGIAQFATGTATAGGASTLTNSAKTWTVNQWANYQVRITGGTGAGQKRAIASNTATVLTTSSAWTINPDATSTYVIEGDENALYLLGNNVVTMYKYSLSGNTWSTLSPSVARAAAPTTGMSAHWARHQQEANWTDESAILNGRRIYSFRGGAGSLLDYYDIPSNAWTNAVDYAKRQETFTTGTSYCYTTDGYIYISKESTGRVFRFSPSLNTIEPFSTYLYTQGAAVLGDTQFDISYIDGATTIRYVYDLLNTSTVMLRCMVI